MKPVLIIDSSSDLPYEYVKKHNLEHIGLTCHFKNTDYEDDFGNSLKYEEFYKAVRAGEIPTTSQINIHRFKEIFEKYVKQNIPIIYIGFSSALSGCVSSANSAKEMLLEKYKNADITVIDTKSASLGEGLLVYYAVELLENAASKETIVNFLEENKLKLNHWFTVDDLFNLKRGGRISVTAAFIGTILDIKPVLHVNNEGKLIPVTKVRGRKKALKMLFEKLKENIINPEKQVIAISHGDCIEDALYLKNLILNEIKVKDIIINNVGPVIGSHSGPGTIALFFLTDKR